ncbi:hypothetical protein BDZ97DRAFT_1764951 [Flammula alnicola]|nr:hypothetical protein BDZ97DRAFT_1764951 [Flammula alnicola]
MLWACRGLQAVPCLRAQGRDAATGDGHNDHLAGLRRGLGVSGVQPIPRNVDISRPMQSRMTNAKPLRFCKSTLAEVAVGLWETPQGAERIGHDKIGNRVKNHPTMGSSGVIPGSMIQPGFQQPRAVTGYPTRQVDVGAVVSRLKRTPGSTAG